MFPSFYPPAAATDFSTQRSTVKHALASWTGPKREALQSSDFGAVPRPALACLVGSPCWDGWTCPAITSGTFGGSAGDSHHDGRITREDGSLYNLITLINGGKRREKKKRNILAQISI